MNLRIEKSYDFEFARNTTYRLGGKAKIAYYPKNAVEAICAYEKARKSGRYFVLGNGSNVLASDKNYDGSVIVTKKLRGIDRLSDTFLYVKSGTQVSEIETYCLRNGLGGLEFLNKIPATMGGIAYMNGGAGGIYFSTVVFRAIVYDGALRRFGLKDCNYMYKHSTMQDINCIILGVILKLNSTSPHIISDHLWEFAERRRHLPVGKSCGCVFKNPHGVSAGKLIEEAGLKGFAFGAAQVSEKHANFIINRGDRSADVFRLIQKVKQSVYEKFGVMLEEEVVLLGDFTDPEN